MPLSQGDHDGLRQNAGTRRSFAAGVAKAAISILCSHQVLSQEPTTVNTLASAERIDTHHHILPPEYVRLAGRPAIARSSAPLPVPEWDVASSLRIMDENGVSAAIVSVSAPGIWFNDAGLAKRLARTCNEFAAQMSADHPHRFGFFAALPLPDVHASLAELQHAVETLRCDGVGLMTNYGDRYLGDAGFRAVFEEINRRGLIVYVHPNICGCDVNVLQGVPPAMIEYPHSTTRTIVSLLASDGFRQWPNIRFIFSHAGGTVPFLVNRINALATMSGKRDWAEQLPTLYYDTAGSANVAALGPLLKLATSKHVVFGSDFPFAPAVAVQSVVRGLRAYEMSAEEIADIERGNARRLFPRFAR